MTRTLPLVLTGIVSGTLGYTAVAILLGRDYPGDTASPQFGLLLAAGAIVVAITGASVAAARPWSRRLRLVVGLMAVLVGFGGLLLTLLASLIAAGMFPDTLLQPLNLTIELVLGLIGLMGIGLLIRHGNAAMSSDTTEPWLVRSWQPIGAGMVIGIGAAWLWSAVILPLIPYRCCLL